MNTILLVNDLLPRHGWIEYLLQQWKTNLRENTRWNVNKTIMCLVRNRIKHRKKYKIGKSPTPLGKISPSGVGNFPILYSPVLDSMFLPSIAVFSVRWPVEDRCTWPHLQHQCTSSHIACRPIRSRRYFLKQIIKKILFSCIITIWKLFQFDCARDNICPLLVDCARDIYVSWERNLLLFLFFLGKNYSNTL
jgi:hypothetical protein